MIRTSQCIDVLFLFINIGNSDSNINNINNINNITKPMLFIFLFIYYDSCLYSHNPFISIIIVVAIIIFFFFFDYYYCYYYYYVSSLVTVSELL